MIPFLRILGLVVAIVLLVGGINMTVLTLVRRRMRRVVAGRFHRGAIRRQSLTANCFGIESLGRAQVRGNGALVLTGDELYFRMAVPSREIIIPLERITTVSLVRSHLGKTIFRPLLKVDYVTDNGPDAVAWAVREPERWKQAIDAGRG